MTVLRDEFDFDRVDDWGPQLLDALDDILPKDVRSRIAALTPEFDEDARDHLFELAAQDLIVERVIHWVNQRTVVGYHGTRVIGPELTTIRQRGLLPLVAVDRAERLVRSLSAHPKWDQVKGNLSAVIESLGKKERGGRREGQVHLTISRAGLQYGFNHYLKQGSEFDWHAANLLLGEEGQRLVAADGEIVLIKLLVPGEVAIEACNPFGLFPPNLPNLVANILRAWAYWLAKPEFKASDLGVDCGMIFRETVPSAWISEIIPLSAKDLQDPARETKQCPSPSTASRTATR